MAVTGALAAAAATHVIASRREHVDDLGTVVCGSGALEGIGEREDFLPRSQPLQGIAVDFDEICIPC